MIFENVKNCFMPIEDVLDFMLTLPIDTTRLVPHNYKRENWTFSYYIKNVKGAEFNNNIPSVYSDDHKYASYNSLICVSGENNEDDAMMKNMATTIAMSLCFLGVVALLLLSAFSLLLLIASWLERIHIIKDKSNNKTKKQRNRKQN